MHQACNSSDGWPKANLNTPHTLRYIFERYQVRKINSSLSLLFHLHWSILSYPRQQTREFGIKDWINIFTKHLSWNLEHLSPNNLISHFVLFKRGTHHKDTDIAFILQISMCPNWRLDIFVCPHLNKLPVVQYSYCLIRISCKKELNIAMIK